VASRKKKQTPDKGKQEEGRKAFLLRLSPDLMSELRAWAAADFRSVNAQIEFLLREAAKRRKKQD
jgi:hypothetical protein